MDPGSTISIDHAPVAHSDLDALAALFEALGFSVSGVCVYASPDDPAGRWTCRAVFLGYGWLDLQWHPERPAEWGAAPHGCLFRVATLEAGATRFPGFRTSPPAPLVRTWARAAAEPVDLRWMTLRERIAPIALTLVDYPHGEDHAARTPNHPNSAYALVGLTFGDTTPGPAAETASARLDLSGFQYLTAADFQARFGAPPSGLRALRFGVCSLTAAASALKAGRLSFEHVGSSIFVPAQAALGCGVEFIQIA